MDTVSSLILEGGRELQMHALIDGLILMIYSLETTF